MSQIFEYLLKVSVSLAVVYLFYHFLLRKLTFYTANRWYLLLYSFCSFLIPLINISPVLEKSEWRNTGIVNYIPVLPDRSSIYETGWKQAGSYESAKIFGSCLLTLLLLGIILMLIRLAFQYFSYLKVKRSSSLLSSEPIRIFQVNEPIIPFSIGNSIFINRHLHNEEELKDIIRHEFVHVKQRHSVDIFLSELLCVLNWYNPFAWFIRRAIKVNLEFIADSKVLETGIDRKEYQCLLLKVIGISQFNIITPFNFSSLKKRIAMMNKKQSAKTQLWKLVLILPVLVVILLAFRNVGRNMPWKTSGVSYHYHPQDTVPSPPKPPVVLYKGKPYDDFLRRNPGVKGASIKNNELVIDLKSGSTETYALSDKERMNVAEKKYGELPVLPAPPPPPPPPAPLPKDVKSIHINESNATVELADGKKEEYDLSKPDDQKVFESKYGSFRHPAEVEKMKRELMEMEMKTQENEMRKIKQERAEQLDRLRENYERDVINEKGMRDEEMRRVSKERQRQFEMMQKQFEEDAANNQRERELALKNAARDKNVDVEKLRRKFELETEHEMAMRKLELERASQQSKMELELLENKMELDQRLNNKQKALQLESQMEDMEKHAMELQEKNLLLQKQINVNQKNMTPEQKKEAISQLEEQKKEVTKVIDEMKSRQAQINKQLQLLKKQ